MAAACIFAVIGFAGTVVYSTALIGLNHVWLREGLPRSLRPGKASLLALLGVTLCDLLLAVVYLRWQLPVWLK